MTIDDRTQVPIFPKIEAKDLIGLDILLFIDGPWVTRWHGRNRRKEFGRSELPPYHAALVYNNNNILNSDDNDKVYILDPEITTSLSLLSEYTTKSAIRIDVFRYKKTVEQTLNALSAATEILRQEKTYDAKGFIFFAHQMPYCDWLKYILLKPSEGHYFCSDAVTYVMQERGGITVSPRGHNETAPVDNQIYGIEHPEVCDKFTLKERTQ